MDPESSAAVAAAPEGRATAAEWDGGPERLDRAMTRLGLVRSRSRAAEIIAAGGVRIDGAAATKAGARVAAGSRIELLASDRYVSRAAHKLLAGLDGFGVEPRGRIALDVGASTGGFTQVLLERGAELVQAIDVGHGQLAEELRGDARVRVVEGCNARELTPEGLAAATGVAERPSLVVADLSFISLRLVLPALARTAAEDAEMVLLVKPQFEVGRVRDGVVTDPSQWAEAIRAVLAAAAGCGLVPLGLAASPIAGGNGNREFLLHLARGERAGAPGADQREWEQRIAQLCAVRPDPGLPGSPARPAGPRQTEGART